MAEKRKAIFCGNDEHAEHLFKRLQELDGWEVERGGAPMCCDTTAELYIIGGGTYLNTQFNNEVDRWIGHMLARQMTKQ